MDKEICFSYLAYLPHLLVREGMVEDISYSFTDMTEYLWEDIVKKDIFQVLKKLLRLDCYNIDINDVGGVRESFLFTKSHNVKQVKTFIIQGLKPDEVYILFLEEKNSRFDDKFPLFKELYKDNCVATAIYSASDLILLKANQLYLNFFDDPYNSMENSIGARLKDIIENFEGSSLEEIWKNAIETGSTQIEREYAFEMSDGRTVYRDMTIIPIKEYGVVKYIVENSIDVTEKVLGRIRLKEHARTILLQKEQMDAVIHNINDMIFVMDEEGRYININKTARKYFPCENLKKVGDSLKFIRYYNSLGHKLIVRELPFVRVARGERIVGERLTAVFANKEIQIDINCTPIFDENGKFRMGIICIRDVTECCRYEKMIKNQLDYTYKIIETLDLPLIRVTYPDLKIIDINRKARNDILPLIGEEGSFRRMPVKGDSLIAFTEFFGLENIKGCLSRMAESRQTEYCNNVKIKVLKAVLYVKIICQPLCDINGDICEATIAFIDVTNEVLEKEKIENAMKIKDEFFSFISHEFKTPLTVINAAIQMLERVCDDELGEKAKKYLGQIRQNSFRQLRLVNNLLDITKAEGGYLKMHTRNIDIVSFTQAIVSSVSQYAVQKDVNLRFESSLFEKVIAADDEKYERILLNLLSNAIKFTPRGKNVVVSIAERNKKVYINVKDEGIGIPEEKQELIFDRFGQIDNTLTRKRDGTGLGLSLVRLLVKSMKGNIIVESEEGRGSTFTVILPAEDVPDTDNNENISFSIDTRLIQSVAVEFSDIYGWV